MQQKTDTKIFKKYSKVIKYDFGTKIRLAEAQAADLERRKFLVSHHTSEAIGDGLRLLKRLDANPHRHSPGSPFRFAAHFAGLIQSRMAPALEAYSGNDKSAFMNEYFAWQTDWQKCNGLMKWDTN